MGIKKTDLRVADIPKKDLPHYAVEGADIEYKFPFGWGELEALHNRGDWDLSNHSKYSGKDLKYQGYFPHVVETSGGLGRSFLAFFCSAYQEIKGARTKTTRAVKEVEVLLNLHNSLAPIKVAILPLVKNKKELLKKAKEIYSLLSPYFSCYYDEAGSIGRRYRRMDEIGTVFCLTCDFQTLEDDSLTIRYRDTMKQERIKKSDLTETIKEKLGYGIFS